MQLDSKDSLYLHPERLVETSADDVETRQALAAILELTSLLGVSSDEGLPDQILNKFVELLPAERSAVLLGGRLDELEALTMRPLPFAVSRSLLGRVLEEKTALLSNDVAQEATGESLVAAKIRALVALPLILDGRVAGAVYLDTSDPKASFPPERLDLLVALASISAAALEKARQMGRLRAETRRLREEYDLVHEMVGESPRLKEAQQILSRVAPTDTTVLIEGESGTGKELAARAIHFSSERKDGPLVKVDCTGLNENLLASELFGHEKGAFTGAVQQKRGKIEIANGGTVFLDEIGELPLALQSQLLRVLQDREFERVGGTRPVAVDIRLVAATNRDLAAEVKAGRFREDLYYRLNVVRLELPPLRERRGDVALLAQYFVAEYSKRVKRPVAGIAPEALSVLERHDWPGNVRELSNHDRARRRSGRDGAHHPRGPARAPRGVPRARRRGRAGRLSRGRRRAEEGAHPGRGRARLGKHHRGRGAPGAPPKLPPPAHQQARAARPHQGEVGGPALRASRR